MDAYLSGQHRWRWRANESMYFCTFCKQRCHMQGVGIWNEPCEGKGNYAE